MSSPRDRTLSRLAAMGREDLARCIEEGESSAPFSSRPARTGDMTLVHDGKSLLSAFDPRREAEDRARNLATGLDEPTIVVHVGLGLGYFAESWRALRPDDELIVYEPESKVLALAADRPGFAELLPKIALYVGPEGLRGLVGSLRDRGLSNGRSPHIFAGPGVGIYAPRALDVLTSELRRDHDAESELLRILVVGPVYGGTLSMGPSVVRAFRDLGHHAELLDLSPFDPGRELLEAAADEPQSRPLLNDLTALLGRAVVTRAHSMNAQLVFFLAQAPATREALRGLREAGIPSAMWFVEDRTLATWWQSVAPELDVFFHIQGEPFQRELEAHRVRHAHYLPVAADPDLHRPLALSEQQRRRYGAAISHMGAGYHNRRRFFLHLLDHDFAIWGNGWNDAPGLAPVVREQGRRVSPDEIPMIFNASTINLNLHSSTYTDGVNPHGDFVNPRTVEIAACGAFQLVDRRALLAEMFVPGEEIAVFDDLASCRRLIEHYLAHPEEAREMAQRARQRVLAEHTYRHRMATALDVIRSVCSIPAPRASGQRVRDLVAASGNDRELAAFVAGLGEPDDELSLDRIAQTIGSREGQLSRPEALFLLMNEFHTWAQEKGLG